MNILDEVDEQETTAAELAALAYHAALEAGTIDEATAEEVQAWKTLLHLTTTDIRADVRARAEVECLQSENPTDEEIADSVEQMRLATNRVKNDLPVLIATETRKAHGELDEASRVYRAMKEKRRVILEQIAALRKNQPRAFSGQ